MPIEEFRRRAHQAVDWVADYIGEIENLPIVPDVKPGDIMALLTEHAPEKAGALRRDLRRPRPGREAGPHRVAASGLVRILSRQHLTTSDPRRNGSLRTRAAGDAVVDEPGVDGDRDEGAGLAGRTARPSPTWMMKGPGGGVIQTTASDSTHTALVVGRHLKSDTAALDNIVAYTSSQSHSSIEKGARVAGYPPRQDHRRRCLTCDGPGQTRVGHRGRPGRRVWCRRLSAPRWVPPEPPPSIRSQAIGEIARRHGMWHHVDAAFAGSAMICPEFRHYQPGLELVDSYVFNPHKWLLTNVDCSVLYVADRAPLLATMSILPPYLRGAAAGSATVVDYRDWHVALGRRFRALKLWWVLRAYGAEGLRSMIREHVRLAQVLAGRVADHRVWSW